MKQWVRNRVVEINRLTNRENWFYVESGNMTAGLGTRKGAKPEDILEKSPWRNGGEWTKVEKKEFPIKSIPDIKLGNEDIKLYNDESMVLTMSGVVNSYLSSITIITLQLMKGCLTKLMRDINFLNMLLIPINLGLEKSLEFWLWYFCL